MFIYFLHTFSIWSTAWQRFDVCLRVRCGQFAPFISLVCWGTMSRSRWQSFTVKEKLEIIVAAEEICKRAALRRHGVNESCIGDWWKKKKKPLSKVHARRSEHFVAQRLVRARFLRRSLSNLSRNGRVAATLRQWRWHKWKRWGWPARSTSCASFVQASWLG